MTKPTVSVVITSYNRPLQLMRTLESIDRQQHWDSEVIVVDDGDDDRTAGICDAYGARHLRTNRVHAGVYLNQAVPLNIGIRAARGVLLLIQNAECRHMDKEVIQHLASETMAGRTVAFARVTSLHRDGTPDQVYCGPENPRPYFFCGMVPRTTMMDLRGFDEDYTGYGYEDDDMADRLRRSGLTFRFTDIPVEHQWHEPAGTQGDMSVGKQMYEWKRTEPVTRNVGREWGVAL